MKNIIINNIPLWFFLLLLISIVIGVWYETEHTVKVCDDEALVVDIIELKHRDATIELDDGRIINVNQATLKKGEPYCLSAKRVSKEVYEHFYYE